MGDDKSTLKVPTFGQPEKPAETAPENTQRLLSGLDQLIKNKEAARTEHVFEVEGQQETLFRAYESLRNSLEYTEEHLLIRGAVARYLRRNFRGADPKQLARRLLSELIRAGYIQNRSLPESTVEELIRILTSYQRLSAQMQNPGEGGYSYFIGIISAHVQDVIIDNYRAPVVVNFIHNNLLNRFDTQNREHADIPMYIAVERILLKSDRETITSRLFRRYFGGYLESSPETIALHYDNFVTAVEQARKSPELNTASSFVRKESAPMLVLVDLLDETSTPHNLLQPGALMTAVRNSANDLYTRSQKRLKRAVVRSIIFLIITKALIGVAVEIPYDLTVHDEIIIVPLVINLLFPPLYLLFISGTIRLPDETNTDMVAKQIQTILYSPEKLDTSGDYERETSARSKSFFNTVYLMLSTAIMVGLVQVLLSLEFNLVSIIVFFMYFSSVSFFSYRIGNVIRELKVYNRRDNDRMMTLISILTAPFVRVGQWLSARYQGLNVMVFIFDFLIEAPFKSIATLYRRWTAFLREKQDEAL